MEPDVDFLRVIDPADLSRLVQRFRTNDADKDTLQSALSAGESFYAVCRCGETLGYYSLKEISPEALLIRDFYLPPAYAVRSLEYLIGQAGDAGYRELQIMLPETDAEILRLFRSRHFKPALSANQPLAQILLRRKMQ